MSRRLYWLSWTAIIVFAAVLRLWQLGSDPVSLYWDEAAMLVDLKSVTQTGKDMHGRPWYQVIYPSYGDYKLPMYIWSASAAVKVFGVSEFAQRLPSALAGILTVVMAGYLAKLLLQSGTTTKYAQLFIDQVQLWTMLIVAIIPWSVMFSRTGFEGHLGQALLTTSITLLVWLYQKQKYTLLWLAALPGVAATYSYFSVRFVWAVVYVLVLGLLLWQHWQREQRKKNASSLKGVLRQLGWAVVGVVVFAVLLLPLLRSPLAKDSDRFRLGTDSVLNNESLVLESNLYRELAGNTIIDRLLYHRYVLSLRELLKNYSDHLSVSFLFLNGDPNLRHGTGQFGLFLPIFAPAMIAGWAVLAKRHPLLAAVLFSWWMTALLPASVPENTPHALRSLNALTPLVIVTGFGSAWIWQKVVALELGKMQLAVPARALITLLIMASCIHFWWFYTSVYPTLSANDWQSGYKPLAQWATSQPEDVQIFIDTFDDRWYLWLMAYGPYTPAEFQSWQSHDYKFQGSNVPNHFGNITFRLPEQEQLEQLAQSGQKFAVAIRPKTTLPASELVQLSCETVIRNEAGQEKFRICTVK